MVGRKGLEPSQIALSVPKTDASTNSAIAPQFQGFIYYWIYLSNDNYKVLKDTYTYKNENGIFLKKNLKKWAKHQ